MQRQGRRPCGYDKDYLHDDRVPRLRESEFPDPMIEDGYDKIFPNIVYPDRRQVLHFAVRLCRPPSCVSEKPDA